MRRTVVQALIIEDDKVLMVKQYRRGGDTVWNLPGGKVEEGETYPEACIREVKEETGYDVKLGKIIIDSEYKIVYEAYIIGGDMFLDHSLPDNDDLLDVFWNYVDGEEYWNDYTRPVIDRFREGMYGRV